ncbi:MAG: DUF3892 domain-containing protein [Mycoplasmatales bacterium]|nr:DUF3892 domain-containing protein [Mycoplasmatales bacterium]
MRTSGPNPTHITHFLTEYGTVLTQEEMYSVVEMGHDYATNIYPYPRLETAFSIYGRKFVRSKGDKLSFDNLMELPRF